MPSPPGWPHIPATYDAVAADYADRFSDELDGKPADRALLDQLAAAVGATGPVLDLGCGPGQIGAYLAARGCTTIGIDLSPGMLRAARARHPQLHFQLGDLRALPLAGGSCAAIACFYSLIHLPRDEVPAALAEMLRVLRPGGPLLLAVHGGDGELHVEGWFDRPVIVDLTLFGERELLDLLGDAGFVDGRAIAREPYPDEHRTPRLYVQAARPS